MRFVRCLGLIAMWFSPFAVTLAAEPDASGFLRAVRTRVAPEWQRMLQNKTDVKVTDAAGNTALHFAALNHDLPAVEALLAAGADADARNAAEATPLLYGAGDAGIVRALLARGVNPNATSKARGTPLMTASSHPRAHEAARLLLDAGADLHAKRTSGIEVMLSRAVNASAGPTVDLLIARGAAKDVRAASLALNEAAMAGDTALVQRLLELGANPNLDPVFAGHALNTALLGEHLETALLLIEKGADLTLRSPAGHGTPPIVWAAYNQSGDASVARALVERKVDVHAANEQGATALVYAQRNGPDSPLARYLRSVGAKAPEHSRAKPVPDRPVPPSPAARIALIRERLPATLALLHRSSDAFLDNAFVQRANCTSCHGQDLPAVAYGLARARGLRVDDISFGRQLALQLSRWSERAELARQMTSPLPGSPMTLAYGLFGLRAARHPADDMTDGMVRYILRTQKPDGAWGDFIRRPPMEDGQLVSTAWVALSVRDYPPAGYEREVADSQQRSARWLAAQRPATHNDAVFQLLGLHWSGVPASGVTSQIAELVRAQKSDGGWSQLPGLPSDAWATGSALFALHQAGAMKPDDPVFQRGVGFLLRTQYDDGSWWVRSRTWPFQPHFNGQFPHGKDQWVSQGATAWGAIALLLALPPLEPAPVIPTTTELIAAYRKSPAARARKAAVANTSTPATNTVDFARDVRPIFERSCVGCHSGERPRGELMLTSRETVLKGGASGEPAIAPGYADDSPMIHYVSGKIEDLEMPPLNRREKYPPLSVAEIDLLRTWIDMGAPWPATQPN